MTDAIWTPQKQAAWLDALEKTERLQSELDVTNADHAALWLEANDPYDGDAWLAVQIVEAHERALRVLLGPDPLAYVAAMGECVKALEAALRFIENTEGEFGITLDSGDMARTALQSARAAMGEGQSHD